MTPPKIRAAGFVLVGGHSRRMGRDKALLELHGKPMLVRTAELLQPCVEEVTLLGPKTRYSGFGLPVLEDATPGTGPLGAVHTALKSSPHSWNLVFACDLPHLNRRIAELLLERTRETSAQAIVPIAAGRYQPLCAAYHHSCIPSIEAVLESKGNHSFAAMLSVVRVEGITPGTGENPRVWEELFSNVNTLDQWEQLQSAAMRGAS